MAAATPAIIGKNGTIAATTAPIAGIIVPVIAAPTAESAAPIVGAKATTFPTTVEIVPIPAPTDAIVLKIGPIAAAIAAPATTTFCISGERFENHWTSSLTFSAKSKI